MYGGRAGTDHNDEISPEKNVLTIDTDKTLLLTKLKDGPGKGFAEMGNLITINVSGRMFVINKCYLEQYPTTLLGSDDLQSYWDPRYNEYFFDRHRDAFESIFDFYLYGKLYPHPHVPPELHQDTVKFFRIMSVFDAQEEEAAAAENITKNTMYEEFKRRLHKTLEDPSYHVSGKIWGWLDLLFIFTSIICMLVETVPDVKRVSASPGSLTGKIFSMLECITVTFFTVDVTIRGFSHPSRLTFMKAPATWLDIMTVAPFFIELFVDFTKLETMKVLRIARVARVLKLIKKNKKLQLIADVLLKSVSELGMLVIVWAMNITVAGVAFYYLEEGPENPLITSATDGMWWAIATMSTVGYGDVYPMSFFGKIFSTFFIWLSMVFLALPLTIIVSTFNKQYEIKRTLTLRTTGSLTKDIPTVKKIDK